MFTGKELSTRFQKLKKNGARLIHVLDAAQYIYANALIEGPFSWKSNIGKTGDQGFFVSAGSQNRVLAAQAMLSSIS